MQNGNTDTFNRGLQLAAEMGIAARGWAEHFAHGYVAGVEDRRSSSTTTQQASTSTPTAPITSDVYARRRESAAQYAARHGRR